MNWFSGRGASHIAESSSALKELVSGDFKALILIPFADGGPAVMML